MAEPADPWCGALGTELLCVPPHAFPVHMGPGCELFSMMLVRRSLGKPCAAGVLGAEGGVGCSCVPCPGGGEALSSFHPTQGEQKRGLCCETALSPAKRRQPPAYPGPARHPSASQGREPRALPGRGSPSSHPKAKAWRGVSR